MHFITVITALLLLLHSGVTQEASKKNNFYLLTVTSQAVGGSTEKLCIQVRYLSHCTLSLTVNLELGQIHSDLLVEDFIQEDYYQCVSFQLPDVSVETEASIGVLIRGLKTSVNRTTKILIRPRDELVFIQTDKPIYKPGQTVKFRIVSLNSDFLTYSQTFQTIELQDPSFNRIGQWLNVSTYSGLVDLSFPTNTESPHGFYIITAWNHKNEPITQTFEISDYVLPKFEVTVKIPPVVTILDSSAKVKVCAKYTYGKPVNGSVKTVVCRTGYRYWWYMPKDNPDICKTYTVKTDKTGCASHALDLTRFALTSPLYQDLINVDSEVKEYGTGVILKGSGSIYVTANIVTVTFEDVPSAFKRGMNYEGKVKVIGPNSTPLKDRNVTLTIRYGNNKKTQLTLVTNRDGIAEFSLRTEQWGQKPVTLEAEYQRTKQNYNDAGKDLTPYYPIAYQTIEPFFSSSGSFITLHRSQTPFSCSKNATITAYYVIKRSTLRPKLQTLAFFYLVLSRGSVIQQGRMFVNVKPGKENRGKVSFQLQKVKELSPVAQVVIYTLLPTGEAVADSMDFPIQLCLPNKVSLSFMSPTELPGVNTTMELRAAPGSLCSLRAIDQSLLLLKPEKRLDEQSVFSLLPVQTLSGYPYSIDDEYIYCSDSPPNPDMGMEVDFLIRPRYVPYGGQNDVYSIFKTIGVKILTNAVVKKTVECFRPTPFMPTTDGMTATGKVPVTTPAVTAPEVGAAADMSPPPITTVRKFFPETWIWDLVAVGQSGMKTVDRTVPDSITTWDTEAFCTSPVGFGLAPKTKLTAFQPFFVSLSKPSSVIRGEVFRLKATVFNYLQACIMVKVTLAKSRQFKIQTYDSCKYSRILCADGSFTFTWTIKPLVLGDVTVNVTASALETSTGNKPVIVPQKGRVDTVIDKLLVLAEGTKQIKTYNELLCSSGGLTERSVSLTLPDVFVIGSAKSSVSVLGDLMGRALKNLASLLAMPSGCGEQNMLQFAPNIFILQYLESSGQLTPEIRSKAETFLITGYQRELNYKHTDGSYSAFGMSDPSGNTWLTAFVMKSFGAAKRYIFIDQQYVDQARAWLSQEQQANGCFASVGLLIHTDMKGGVNDEVTLSAYIAAALLELGVEVTDPVVTNSLICLSNAASHVTSTYAMALMAYTFTLAGDQTMRSMLLTMLDGRAILSVEGRHWSREDDGTVDSLEVEMTSYVLLSLLFGPSVSGFDMGYCASIVHWLAQKQNAFGGFASTQDTVVALQALAKYSSVTYSPAGSIKVTVTSLSGLRKEFMVNQRNRLLYQESQLQKVPEQYRVEAEGTGCVYVQFTVRYNIPPPADCSSFKIAAKTTGKCKVLNPTIEVTVTVRYKGKRDVTNMVVIEVKLLSGFKMVGNSVKPLNNALEDNGTVKRVDQSEGQVFIYLNRLMNGEEMSYSMMIKQEVAVQNLKPAVIKVYDYYETGDAADAEYTSPCITK